MASTSNYIMSVLDTHLTGLVMGASMLSIGCYIYLQSASHLSKIPNIHWLAPWTRCYNLYIKYFFSTRDAHLEAHLNRSGGTFRPLIRLGPNKVSIMTTEGVRSAFGGGFERTPWYSVFHNFGWVDPTP